jgi:hypothetical protein
MKLQEVKIIVKLSRSEPEGMRKDEATRVSQSEEGKKKCFGTASSTGCGELDCCWRDDCLIQRLLPILPANMEATGMTCKIDVNKEFNYVFLSVTGVLDISSARACRDKLNEVLLAFNRTRVLADVTRLTAKLSIIEDYEFTKELKCALPSGVAMALVVPQMWTIDGRFIEHVAVNNGMRVRSFTKKADALVWLARDDRAC